MEAPYNSGPTVSIASWPKMQHITINEDMSQQMFPYETIQAPRSGPKRQSWAQNNTWLSIPPPAQNCQISAAKKACYNFPQHYYRGTCKIIR